MGKVSVREIHLLKSAQIRKENNFPFRKVEKSTPSNALSCEVVMRFRSAVTTYFPVSVATFKRAYRTGEMIGFKSHNTKSAA